MTSIRGYSNLHPPGSGMIRKLSTFAIHLKPPVLGPTSAVNYIRDNIFINNISEGITKPNETNTSAFIWVRLTDISGLMAISILIFNNKMYSSDSVREQNKLSSAIWKGSHSTIQPSIHTAIHPYSHPSGLSLSLFVNKHLHFMLLSMKNT